MEMYQMSALNRGWSLLTSAVTALKFALAAFVACLTLTSAHAQYTTPYSATYITGTSYNGQSFYVGTPFVVNVTMQNTGYVTWTSSSLFRLGSQAPQDNMNWGANRIELPGDVAPGQEANFSFYATAPSTPGWYQMQWQMVSDYCCWFGDLTPSVWIYASGDKAQFVSQSVPAQIYPGSTVPVSVTMKNTGISTWTAGALYRLGSQSPQDNSTWGLGRVELPNDVAPGQNVTFNFSITAPTSSGNQWFQWRMVNDNNGWFGDYTPQTPVDVSINNAAFVSQSVPGSMQPGHTYPVTVTMQNNGTSTWKTGTNFRLGSQNPEDNGTWGLGRIELPSNVAPGQNVTFAFNVTSPSTPGTYNFQWEMVDDGYQWFGVPSANVAIPVGFIGPVASLYENSHTFSADEVYGASGHNPEYSLVVTNTGDQPLNISGIKSSGPDFYVRYDGCSGNSIAPNPRIVTPWSISSRRRSAHEAVQSPSPATWARRLYP
jgi:uncharacterized protein affecting Mg2+/Co2+ transport